MKSTVRIVVSAEQAQQIASSREAIEIVDEHGNWVGYFTQPFSVSEILEAKRRSATEKGGRTTEEVLRRLEALDAE